ncbi:MAG: M28 family peptidase [Planctomycetes bacterium]|nr:M28 family peptidase [Planctomycetota bacterium]
MSLPLLCLLLLQGTPAAPIPPASTTARILAQALESGQAYSKLQALCTRAPKRLSGSPGAAAAVAWAKAAMEADGLENVHLEECSVPVWQRGKRADLSVVEPESSGGTFLPITALGGSIGTGEKPVEGPLLVVTSFEELTAAGERARGAIVLFNRPMDPTNLDPFDAYGKAVDQRSRGAVEAAKVGALAAIVRSMTTRLDDVPHTGAMRYEDAQERVPTAAVSTAGAERLAALARAGNVRLRFDQDCQILGEAPSHNVVGDLRGRELPNEIVLVGGHLDAWDVGQGAVDDGSGCVQSIEAARLWKSLGLRARRTLRVVLFMNEENGLRGGLAYRDAHRKELSQHVLAIETDRGGFVPRGFEFSGGAATLAALEPLRLELAPAGAGDFRLGGGGADISPLAKEGVPVMELVPDPQRYFDFHHCVRDTLDAVHPRELELGAGCLSAMAWFVAERAERLPAAH